MKLTIREYSLFAIGLLAAVWFFVAYPSQDPRTIIDLSIDAGTIEKKAITRMEALGYSPQNYEVQTRFRANQRLLDSLQQGMGRDQLIDSLRQQDIPNLEPYYWEITFRRLPEDQRNITVRSGSDESGFADENAEDIKLRFDDEGNLLEVLNPAVKLPVQTVNRSALAAAFPVIEDSAASLFSAYRDSVLVNSFLVDLQRGVKKNVTHRQLDSLLKQQGTISFSRDEVVNMATFYLRQSAWFLPELSADSVQLGRANGTNTVSVGFNLKKPKLGQNLSLIVDLTTAGSLLSITSEYNSGGRSGSSFQGLWPIIQNAIIFLFCVAGVIIFFFRIRARAIDTKPALVVAILAGIAISILVILGAVPNTPVFSDTGDWTITIAILVGAGVAGAAASIGFFVMFSIGDSITRQHWGQKLEVYDYLRQGMIFNKPLGKVILRSLALAFSLAGFWTLLLYLFPGLIMNIETVFLHEQAAWPPLYVTFSSGWYSLIVILGIFLVLGGQVFAQTRNKMVSAVFMMVACVIVVPVSGSYGPLMYEILAAALFGAALTAIYLQWDFLTLFLTHFLFLGLLKTAPGWIIAGSEDTYIFISLLLFMGFLAGAGMLAVSRGKEERVLSRYVPEYIEELAQEERIKQELQIAREVQQSFLPVSTPSFESLELAAICKPAYETGGDYYDFIPLDDHRVAVTIGDVSGKGIQAAFYMTFVKGIIHSLCREIDSPAELLKKANRLFFENAPRGIFISLVYGIVDLKQQTFRFARAGHNPILRVTAKNGNVQEIQPEGIGIGLARAHSFDDHIDEVELQLSPDDVLILYTDGIVEALDENHNFYGSDRLNTVLAQNKNHTAGNILHNLAEDVRTFIGSAKQHDDMTIMVMKLKNTNAPL